MTTWRLRRASVDDAAAVALVARASFLDTFAGVLSGADILAHLDRKSRPEQFAAWSADPAAVLTLAEHATGAAPIGYSLLTPPEEVGETGPGDIELRRIYTLSAARGTGLGAALMAQAIDDARARAFYERQGFAVVAERRFKVGETWCDDRVYARDL